MRSEQRKEIQDLVQILTDQNLTEIEVERKDLRIRIRRDHAPMISTPPVSAPPVIELVGKLPLKFLRNPPMLAMPDS